MPSGSMSMEITESRPSPVLSIIAQVAGATLVRGSLEADRAAVIAGMFKALGDPVRLRLLSMIASAPEGEICVCDLSGEFALTGPTISHHLRILREAGVVDCDRRGTWVYYRAVPETLSLLADVLEVSPLSP
ncbi:metalloregulator ArsR/SmtB family transcription factor [Actinoplanes sp. NPDC023714]|uniref:ArsR/SmtB family transcription factor n=1 Tax=Actinoplanes sp. NPDC023714 TaxID=3154322 RepID=UPI00340786B8